jgi:hypothetical protein
MARDTNVTWRAQSHDVKGFMNKIERDLRPDGLAEIEYLDGEYRVIRPGAYVVCAVTGVPVPIESLRYWSVDLQEAYATPAVALKRFQETGNTPK